MRCKNLPKFNTSKSDEIENGGGKFRGSNCRKLLKSDYLERKSDKNRAKVWHQSIISSTVHDFVLEVTQLCAPQYNCRAQNGHTTEHKMRHRGAQNRARWN